MSIERDTAATDIEDRFQRGFFVDSLVDLLLDTQEKQARGFVVGLTGPWGSGKSQVMLYVEKRLREECAVPLINKTARPSITIQRRVVIVRFNPWLHAGQDDLLRQFFRSIRDEVMKTNDPALQNIASRADNLKSVARKFSGVLKAIPVVGTGAAEAAAAALEESSLEKEKEQFAKTLQEAHASAIVLVDEIDRLSDQEIREIAQMVKSVADFPMFSYLLAYDPDRVAKALGRDDTKLGYQYLEKIVQVQARLPRVDPKFLVSEIGRQILPIVFKSGTDGSGDEKRRSDWMEMIDHLVPDIIATPRDARRLAAAIALRWPLLHEEVNSFDLVRYCALEARVPILSERIQHRTRRISVDGSRELRRRFETVQPAAECISDILGEYQSERPLRDLLVYLFPALREQGSEEVTRDDDRLCYETPLLSLLNYGPVAGMIGRSDAKSSLVDKETKLSNLLTRAAEAGRLRHAVLRLRSVYRALEDAGELKSDRAQQIWTHIGEFFDRGMTAESIHSWDSWLELTHVFVRGALRNYVRHDHISREFVAGLIHAKQIHLPARILMFHIQAYGLFGMQRDSLLTPVLTEKETRELLLMASKALKDQVLNSDGNWRLRSVVPLWVIRAGDDYDKHWPSVRDRLKHPKSPNELDCVLVLAMRYRNDEFSGTTLPQELNLDEIEAKVRALQNPEPELRTPTDVAYQFLRSQLRH
jgi:hypothetical protein